MPIAPIAKAQSIQAKNSMSSPPCQRSTHRACPASVPVRSTRIEATESWVTDEGRCFFLRCYRNPCSTVAACTVQGAAAHSRQPRARVATVPDGSRSARHGAGFGRLQPKDDTHPVLDFFGCDRAGAKDYAAFLGFFS